MSSIISRLHFSVFESALSCCWFVHFTSLFFFFFQLRKSFQEQEKDAMVSSQILKDRYSRHKSKHYILLARLCLDKGKIDKVKCRYCVSACLLQFETLLIKIDHNLSR